MAGERHDTGLLGQDPPGSNISILLGLDEPAGKRPLSPEGRRASLDEQDDELTGPNGEQRDVDGERDCRIWPVVARAVGRMIEWRWWGLLGRILWCAGVPLVIAWQW